MLTGKEKVQSIFFLYKTILASVAYCLSRQHIYSLVTMQHFEVCDSWPSTKKRWEKISINKNLDSKFWKGLYTFGYLRVVNLTGWNQKWRSSNFNWFGGTNLIANMLFKNITSMPWRFLFRSNVRVMIILSSKQKKHKDYIKQMNKF